MILVCRMMLNNYLLCSATLCRNLVLIPSIIATTALTRRLLRGRYACSSLSFSPRCSAGGKYTLFSRVGSTLRPPAPLRKSQPTACPAGRQSVVNRADQVPRQVPLITRIARFPTRKVQQVAQPIPNVLSEVACETVALACSKVRRVIQPV